MIEWKDTLLISLHCFAHFSHLTPQISALYIALAHPSHRTRSCMNKLCKQCQLLKPQLSPARALLLAFFIFPPFLCVFGDAVNSSTKWHKHCLLFIGFAVSPLGFCLFLPGKDKDCRDTVDGRNSAPDR